MNNLATSHPHLLDFPVVVGSVDYVIKEIKDFADELPVTNMEYDEEGLDTVVLLNPPISI